MMDWSSGGMVAMSSGQDVMLWRNLDESTMVFSVESPTSLKYSPDGKHLAIGCMDRNYPGITDPKQYLCKALTLLFRTSAGPLGGEVAYGVLGLLPQAVLQVHGLYKLH